MHFRHINGIYIITSKFALKSNAVEIITLHVI